MDNNIHSHVGEKPCAGVVVVMVVHNEFQSSRFMVEFIAKRIRRILAGIYVNEKVVIILGHEMAIYFSFEILPS